jgi:hypothetical protein
MPKEKSRQLVNKPRVEFAMKEKVRARGAHAGSMANRKHGKGANTLQGEQSNVLQSVSVATSAKTMRHVLTRIRVLWQPAWVHWLLWHQQREQMCGTQAVRSRHGAYTLACLRPFGVSASGAARRLGDVSD